jgi:hypothetical protein
MRFFATLLLAASGGALAAQSVPATINYQGRITDNTPQQNPFTGGSQFVAAIYDAPTGGTQLWQEPASGALPVMVNGGVFSVLLGGNGVPLPPSLFSGGADRYLEITFNGETLTPRQTLSATGYANQAENAASAANAANATYAAAAADSASLGGQPAANYLLATGTAADSAKLGGVAPGGYLLVGGTAADSSKLGGVAASGYLLASGTAANSAQLGGIAASGYLLTSGTAANSAQLGGVADTGWQKKLATPACPANQFLATLNQDGSTACAAPPAAPSSANYAFAYDTTTQTIAVPNLFQDLVFSTNAQFNGWTHPAGTAAFTCATTGLYRLHYTAIAQKTAGGTAAADLRLTVNGVEAAGSVTGASLSVNNVPVPLAHEALLPLIAGDVLHVQYAGGSTSVQVTPAPGSGTTRPSATLVIERVN